MSKVFKPKIIIGSIAGFIVSAIGFLAIFFPSVFNFETKKIEEYKISITEWKDIYDFKNKLIGFAHNKEIFKLDVTYAKTGDMEQELNDKESEYFSFNPNTGEKSIHANYSKVYDNIDIIMWNTFEFNNINFIGSQKESLYKINGYFIYEGSDSYAGGIQYRFKHINDELVHLKKY